MTDPTDLNPPTGFEQPIWKPRHRVDPYRPANPHTHDPDLEDLYQDFYKERVGRTGPNLTAGLILLVVFLIVVAATFVMLWAFGAWTS